MKIAVERFFVALSAGELIMGVLGNGFIGFTYCSAWFRHQRLSLVGLILISLACSRVSQLCLSTVDFSNSVLFSETISAIEETNPVLIGLWLVNNHLSVWLATCLAVFYFLKISNFSYPLFLWLRWRVSKVIFILLLGSAPFLFMTFPSSFHLSGFWYHIPNKYDSNRTGSFYVSKINNLSYMITFIIASSPPFFLSSTCFLLLLLSLRRHAKQLVLNGRPSRDSSMEAHFRAMKAIFLFLLLFILYQLAVVMTFMSHMLLHNKLIMMFGYIIGLSYPSVHSYVLIFGNSQMRTDFLRMLWYLKCGLKGQILSAT